MATNAKYADGDVLSVVCTAPTTPASGGPVIFGKMPGVAVTDERTDGTTTVAFKGVHTLSVAGIDASGNLAIAAGDILYYTDGDTPKVNVKATGVRFGYALAAVTSGATASIDVRVGY